MVIGAGDFILSVPLMATVTAQTSCSLVVWWLALGHLLSIPTDIEVAGAGVLIHCLFRYSGLASC